MSEYPIYDFPWDPPHHEKHSRQLSHRSAKNKCMMHGAVVFILLHVFTISPSFPTEQSLQHNRPCIAWVDGMVYLINSGAGSAEAPLAPSYVRRLCMQKLRKSWLSAQKRGKSLEFRTSKIASAGSSGSIQQHWSGGRRVCRTCSAALLSAVAWDSKSQSNTFSMIASTPVGSCRLNQVRSYSTRGSPTTRLEIVDNKTPPLISCRYAE